MVGSPPRFRDVATLTIAALGAVVLVGALLGGSADAFDNRQQNPVAGDPHCADVFPGSSQLRSDAPGRDENPTGTVPAQHHPAIERFEELVGVIVHGGASGSNVYDSTTGMNGRLISTRNPGGGLAAVDYTLLCYTTYSDPTVSTGNVSLVYSDSGHQVAVVVDLSLPSTTTGGAAVAGPSTTIAAVPTKPPFDIVPTTVPDVAVPPDLPRSTPASPVVGQPTFTG